MSTALRLRTLADIIETNNLPDPRSLSLYDSGGAAVHYDGEAAVRAWAEATGSGVRVQRVDDRSGGGQPFTAYVVEMSLSGFSYVTVVFHDYAAQVSA